MSKNVTILTDSTADLGRERAHQRAITVIPLSVNINKQTFRDGEEIEPDQLFNLVESARELPKTSAPPVGAFLSAFEQAGECVFIGISSQMSACVQNARLAAQEFPPGQVQVIDSRNVSCGLGLLALQAADWRDAGCPADEIEARLLGHLAKVRSSFFIETLDYLYKGGRCSQVEAVVGSLLKIHPVIEVRQDGTMGMRDKVRGTRKRAMKALLSQLVKDIPHLDRQRIFVAHAGCRGDAELLRQEIERMAAPAEIHIVPTGSVISSHCGPGTVGLFYTLN